MPTTAHVKSRKHLKWKFKILKKEIKKFKTTNVGRIGKRLKTFDDVIAQLHVWKIKLKFIFEGILELIGDCSVV